MHLHFVLRHFQKRRDLRDAQPRMQSQFADRNHQSQMVPFAQRQQHVRFLPATE